MDEFIRRLRADWDIELLGTEQEELKGFDFDLTGFDENEIVALLADPDADDPLIRLRVQV